MALFEVTAYDKKVWEEELKDFLPEKFIDCHTHVWLMKHDPNKTLRSGTQNWPGLVAKENSIEDLLETNRLLFPDNKVVSVLYGDCAVSIDRKAVNSYVAEKAIDNGFPALYLCHPNTDPEELERIILEKDKKASVKYNHTINLETFLKERM